MLRHLVLLESSFRLSVPCALQAGWQEPLRRAEMAPRGRRCRCCGDAEGPGLGSLGRQRVPVSSSRRSREMGCECSDMAFPGVWRAPAPALWLSVWPAAASSLQKGWWADAPWRAVSGAAAPQSEGLWVGRSAASPGVILPGLGGAIAEPGVACGVVTTDSDAAARTTSVSSRRRPRGQLSTSDPFPGVSSFGTLPRSRASSPDPGPPAPVQGPCEDTAPENAEWPPPAPRPHLLGRLSTRHVQSRLLVPGAGCGCLEPDTPPRAP